MSYTYANLKSTIQTITKRGSGLAEATIEQMVRQAEAVINRDLRADEMVSSVTLDETDRSSGPLYNLPNKITEVVSVTGTLNSNPYGLTQVGLDELHTYGADNDPYWYSIIGGDQIEFRGTPDTDAEFTLTYYGTLTELSSAGDTNNVLLYHRDIYITGTLRFLFEYLEDFDQASYYGDRFSQAIEAMNAHATRTRKGKTAPSHNLGIFLARSAM